MSGKPKQRPARRLPAAADVPAELRGMRRWCGFRFEWDESKGKFRKPPHSPVDGSAIGATMKYAEHFLDYDGALNGVAKHGLDGVGFVFVGSDGLVGLDFDGCVENGAVHDGVKSWLRWFPTYAEVSPSGSGVHAICRGSLSRALTATPLADGGPTVEAYSDSRYFTFTGERLGDHAGVTDCEAGIKKLLAHLGKTVEGGKEAPRPMSRASARRIHAENLDDLRNAPMGRGNELLNTTAFFAARAFLAGALDGDERHIKDELLRIVTEEWASPHPRDGALKTMESGWSSGTAEGPLAVAEDEFPEASAAVEEFNGRFFHIRDYGGHSRVGEMKVRLAGPKSKRTDKYLSTRSIGEFRNAYLGDWVESGVRGDGTSIRKTRAEVWLADPGHRRVEEVVYAPGQELPSGVMNLWQGFAVPARKGDCSIYLQHLAQNICNGNPSKYRVLMSWMAWGARHPELPGNWAVVVQGEKGVGKNAFAEPYADLFGEHGLVVSGEHAVTSNFNTHMMNKSVLVADEALFAGDPRQDRIIKGLVTGTMLRIEPKGVDSFQVPNLLHIIILGNDERLVRATADERRYFFLRCGTARRKDQGFFGALKEQMDNGGKEALLWHLLHEVTLMEMHDAPHTDALQTQMTDSLEGIEAVWFECLLRGELPGAHVEKDGTAWLRAPDLVSWASRQNRRGWGGISVEKVANLLGDNPRVARRGMGFAKGRPTLYGSQTKAWFIPRLAEARANWTDRRFKHAWSEDGQWESVDLLD